MLFLFSSIPLLETRPVWAGVFEISGSFSFSNSNLGNDNYQWSRHWELGVGYYFWGYSEIEFSVEAVLNRTEIFGLEDTTFHDQVFSLNWIQYFASKKAFVSPYLKVGVGQLEREASGYYWAGGAPPAIYGSVTAVLGAGLRINLSQAVSLHGEATSYLTRGSILTWKDNISLDFGISCYLF